ncbi:endo-1,4-beta-xylanase [Pedobacter glucosidilyticus]|uniref:endo-1,4-beta-xylanase n=1 Tax=Pedobacter glucosidilyticus TaxID=1122941 RepID=UPI0004151597|nr:endo-1,4-beta-xylanase [Pedobacter glucosidilyticus]
MRQFLVTIILIIYTLTGYSQQASLSLYANSLNLKIGTAVGGAFYSNYLGSNTYINTIKNNYNILVSENDMKFKALQPTRGNFNFTNADKVVDFAIQNGMQIRGHTLVWHANNPTWLSDGLDENGVAYTRQSLLAVLKNHITTVVTRYKNKIQQWDVVNEPIEDNGTLRANIWQQIIGNDYIDSALVWANQADPAAKLYINDYYIEATGSVRSNAMFNLITSLKQRNIPIHGVGFQCHFFVNNIFFTQIDRNIKNYAAIGIDVAITELDIRIKNTDYDTNSALQLSRQAEDYRRMLLLCLNNPNCKTFMTWGFTDLYSWIPNYSGFTHGYALPFDSSYNPKPAYTSMLNELFTQAATLPVSFLNISAKSEFNKTVLRWQTQDQVNLSHFTIEKSVDGKVFNLKHTEPVKQAINNISFYQFEDLEPLSTIAYYRVVGYDYDGKTTKSNIVVIANDKTPLYNLQFNRDKSIMVNLNSSFKGIIQIVSIDGRLIAQKIFNNEETKVFQVFDLETDLIVLNIKGNNISESKKIKLLSNF